MTTYKIFCSVINSYSYYVYQHGRKRKKGVCNGRGHHTPMAGDATNSLPVNWPLLLLLLSAVIPLS